MSSDGSKSKKKRYKISPLQYEQRLRALRPYVKFNFLARKKFTPPQKRQITINWLRLHRKLVAIRDGVVKFKPVQSKKLRKTLSRNYPHTNKGIFIHDRDKNVKIITNKKEGTLEFERNNRIEKFIPYYPKIGQNFATWALNVIENNYFDVIMLRVGFNHGLNEYDPVTAERYFQRDVYNITREYERRGEEQPFTGLFLVIIK